jgi:hypothetical protein
MKAIFKCQLCETVFDGEDITYAVELRNGRIVQYLQERSGEQRFHDCNQEAMGIGLLIGIKK